MFPLKDSVPSSRFPYVTWAIIIVNIVIFIKMAAMPDQLETNLVFGLGLVPKRVFVHNDLYSMTDRILPFFTSMFMHGGWLHVLGNMYFLFIFGDNVEDRLGHFRYLVMYIVFGLCAAASEVFFMPNSPVPMIGASGAVAGVMGAYLIMFPRATVKTLLIIIFFITIVEIPAVVFLGLWFVMQFLNGAVFNQQGVAWWAHIGGFIAGVAYAVMIVRNRKNRYRYQMI